MSVGQMAVGQMSVGQIFFGQKTWSVKVGSADSLASDPKLARMNEEGIVSTIKTFCWHSLQLGKIS
jgi:hypothetical protein